LISVTVVATDLVEVAFEMAGGDVDTRSALWLGADVTKFLVRDPVLGFLYGPIIVYLLRR
jgi:hypothetical protein